jgi:hypothetical protein
MPRGLDEVDDGSQTPTRRPADTFPLGRRRLAVFRVARSTVMIQRATLYRQSGSDALKNNQLTCGEA